MRNDGSGFAVHDLGAVARPLTGGADALGGMADRHPEAPDAGASSAGIAAALSSIATAASGIVRSAVVAVARVEAGAQSYVDIDEAGGELFGGVL